MCQAIREMREESRMEGLEAGRLEGIAEGEKRGRLAGVLEGEIKTYIKFGYSAEDIAKEINLPVSEIEDVMGSLD